MNVDEMIQGAQNALAVSRVYGEPIQKNGVTLIPTAEVLGGGGGGSDQANNGGGGFGVRARPVGVWVIRGEQVEWEPAMDATKMALRGMLVAIVFLFVVRSVVKTFAGR
ncbi:MAG TPA: spore germination protein GerW family protein [Candidatus Limnocylindria bacterium]|nr:spore germination protein GerW family protein [Candidatus Limnocylindria bacterium]